MNDKIKEKLECLKTVNDNDVVWPVYQQEAKILLDYIINLQEENKNLKNEQISKYQTLKELQDENNKFDETMKDIKDNLIARINRQECEIHNLKAELEMYENGVYFSSENNKLQEKIDNALEYVNTHKPSDTISFPLMKKDEENQVKSCFDYEFREIYQKELLDILQGNKWNEVERAYLDDKPIGSDKE